MLLEEEWSDLHAYCGTVTLGESRGPSNCPTYKLVCKPLKTLTLSLTLVWCHLTMF